MNNELLIIDILKDNAANQGSKKAYIFLNDGEKDEKFLTYSELNNISLSIASNLTKYISQGQTALLIYPSGLDFITAFFACLYSGIIAIPAYPPDITRIERSLNRLFAIIKNSKVKYGLTQKANILIINEMKKKYPIFNEIKWIATDQTNTANTSGFKEVNFNKESIAYLQYTSGSTASPKGVMISHENTIANLKFGKYYNGFNKESKIVGWVPLYHDLGLIAYVLGTVYYGLTCILMSPIHFLQKPYRWLKAISDYRGTHNAAPPFAYSLCSNKISHEQKNSLDLSCWKVAGVGAETVSYGLLQKFAYNFKSCGFNINSFYPTYGMAENVLYITGGKKDKNALSFLNICPESLKNNTIKVIKDNKSKRVIIMSCGQTTDNQEIVIVDPETFEICKEDQVGEIWIKGPCVAQGYFNNDSQTIKIFNAYTNNKGPFLRTGDIGFLYKKELFITGRLKDMIIIRGKNYYPQDIEQTTDNIHSLLRKGCLAVFSIISDNQEKIVYVQELKKIFNHSYDDTELKRIINLIRNNIQYNHDINVYGIILIKSNTIPKTSSGKIQRSLCKKLFQNNKLEIIKQWFANKDDNYFNQNNNEIILDNPDEIILIFNKIQNIIAEKLKIDKNTINLNSNIRYDLGIDSLAFFEIVYLIELEFDLGYIDDEIWVELKRIEDIVHFVKNKL